MKDVRWFRSKKVISPFLSRDKLVLVIVNTALMAASACLPGNAATPISPPPDVATRVPFTLVPQPTQYSQQPPSTPVIVSQDCGKIVTLGPNPPADASAERVQECFWQAFQECRTATLTITVRGVDTAVQNQLTIEKRGSQCTVTNVEQSFAVNLPTPAVSVFSCARLERKPEGLLFVACSTDGDILVRHR